MRIITPKVSLPEYFSDLWDHIGLLKSFVIRDILVRYKLALLGIAWALIRPLLNMIIFVILFEKMAHLPSNGVHYPLFVLAALLPWQLISNTIQSSNSCLINHKELISKIYFPRILLPMSSVFVNGIDLIMGYMVFFSWGFFTSQITLNYLFPLIIAETFLLALALSFWFSALTIKYRDIAILAPFITQVGLFISPIGYSSALFPKNLQWLMQMNPMAGIIDGFRYAFFGGFTPNWILSFLIILFLLISGFLFFKWVEKELADIL